MVIAGEIWGEYMEKLSDTSGCPYDVSIIVPFYNERENLGQAYDEITAALATTSKSYEIIFIDDGSTDDSSEYIADLAKKDERVKLVEFSRNFGQTAAMAAGFKHAKARVYVAMDADNQNDPADIPELLAKLDEGYDVVSGWRKKRRDKLITRRIPSIVANRLLSSVTGVRLHDYGCSLKAYRAEYIDSIELYGEMHRFIPAYAHMAGAKVVEIPVNHRARTRGTSKYGMIRIFKVLMDLITVKFLSSYATKPGYLFGGMGSVLCLGGMAAAFEVLIEKFAYGTFAHKNPFLLLAVFLFFLGVQMILMGLIAELLARTYHESQNKAIYLIKKTVNLD
jgi:glycosyltransferase involved in cell wall biosynthesis